MLDNQAKKDRRQSTPLSPVMDETHNAGTTPNDTNALEGLEPEFDLTGTVLNDYS
ncbi:hypothetical protein [Cytobacillus sp. NCCP-133]|uniref:hypothetical protein n=1 Tax=Cytobacillus sp. NCCP-133 TaxID=766848 RepID=UPI00222EADF4|nr:hypothetical protein [Cytobacillus sp. NCCP-133]GLB60035.1 hypothetical protein NCCP133_21670 [Cytobacillus sp. NCCP-133]